MKKTTFASVLTIVAAVAMAAPASAEFKRGFTGASAGGSNSGFNGSAFDSNRNMTRSSGENSLVSRADTDPNYGAAVARMNMRTGGRGADNSDLSSQSVLDGDQGAFAQVGRKGVEVNTTTDGEINQMAAGAGDRVLVGARQRLKSEQSAVAVDTRHGGDGRGEAQVVGYSVARGEASGEDSSTMEMNSGMSVEAGVTVLRRN